MTPADEAEHILAAAEYVRAVVEGRDDVEPPPRTPPRSAYRGLRTASARRAWLNAAAKTLDDIRPSPSTTAPTVEGPGQPSRRGTYDPMA